MAENWKNERPAWCPHEDCRYRLRAQDALCVGHLRVAVPHHEDNNTYRICINDEGDRFDLQINDSDIYHFKRLFEALSPTPHEQTAKYWRAMFEEQVRRKRETLDHTK